MKVSEKETEVISTKLDNGMDFNELTSPQIGTLRTVSSDKFDYAEASEKMFDSVGLLQLMGLIDSDVHLTTSGIKAIELASVLGGSKERRRAAIKDTVEVDDSDVYVDGYEDYEDNVGVEPTYNRFR